MKPQTFGNNVIRDIWQERARQTRDPMDMAYAQKVVDTYRVARLDPKAIGYLDDLTLAFCGKSLTDIVKDYEEPGDLGE
jgi:hypothetical protein